MATTKERILDAAEALFSDQGFATTSLRSITAAAEVNLAAVNYHFGSKEQLIEEVFVRRLGPINRERLENRDRWERGAGEEGPTLEQIIEAFLGPPLRMGHEPERGGAVFVRLLGHTISQPDDRIREMFTRQFREVVPRFIAAFRRRIPDLPTAEIFWRFLFLIGSMAHTMALRNRRWCTCPPSSPYCTFWPDAA